MPTSKNKLQLRRPVVVVDVGCGCSRRPKLPSFFANSPSPSPAKPTPPFSPSSSSSSHFDSIATPSESPITSAASNNDKEEKSKKRTKEKQGRRVLESVAVVKESEDPYLDFRDSMLLMIVEKEIYALEDLKHLLHRFLSLNAPCHHPFILQAFAEIWHGVFSAPSPSLPPLQRAPTGGDRNPLHLYKWP